MRRQGWARRHEERGSEAVEAAIGVPAFILFVVLIIAGGRIALAQQAVQSAAADAARSATIERTQSAAVAAATSTARTSLQNQNLRCTGLSVAVNASGFGSRPGTPGMVNATVTCVVQLSDLSLPGLPGSLPVEATMSSPIDTYRARTSGFTISEGGTTP